ncbi:FtsX-like permease family protein [Actinokineospora sp. NPDC004072]
MSGWRSDLLIGVRLAVGGGRTSMARFVLSSIGVGIAVVVLLMAASAGTVAANRDARGSLSATDLNPVAGVDPTLVVWDGTAFRGERINVKRVRAAGPNSPVPPGLPRMPAADEMYVSQALADLLADPDSALLKPRFPQRVVGVLPAEVVADPYDLLAYTGLRADYADEGVSEVYKFGVPSDQSIPPEFLLVLLLGVVALLVPVFIFVASSTRIAGAERDRRLAALRLVGGDSRQVRRIAAAEALVSALAGMVLGAIGFVLLRPVAASVRLMGVGVYEFDVVPNWWLVGVIAVAVPVLAVLTAQTALRRTIIEPLGVVRFSRPVRRRVAWRLLLVAAGAVLLLWNTGDENSDLWAVRIATGATLMLVGVPVLLPVVVERVVSRLRGGPPSWQLAVRRLQLDSGTSARVIGGVAVVLAGAIALQALLVSQASAVGLDAAEQAEEDSSIARSWVDREREAAVTGLISGVEGVEWVARFTGADIAADVSGSNTLSVSIGTCADIERVFQVVDCTDGEVFAYPGTTSRPGFTPGQSAMSVDWAGEKMVSLGTWTIPQQVRELATGDISFGADLIATPKAAPPQPADRGVSLRIKLDPDQPDAIEHLRNAAFGNLSTDVYLDSEMSSRTDEQENFLTIQRGLLIGSVFTLMLAGVSLLVLAVEQIRERRRPLAVLAASGVPTGAIARSLLWQIGVPIGLGVLVALGTGVGLAALVNRLTNDPLLIDWAGVGVMTAAAAVLGLLVCLVTLPFLRSATRVESLRTE